jgi:uncharacterized protein (TIGR03437 family)
VSGRAGSSDLVLADTPEGCRPSANQVLGFVARLAPDGVSASGTQLVQGVADCLYLACDAGLTTYRAGWALALRPAGTVVVAGANGSVASIDFSSGSRVACLTDPADNAHPTGCGAQSSNTFGVFFNSIPAPILYSSAQQINVQVPYEIAGANTVKMQVRSTQISNPVSETRTLGVVERQPAIFLSLAALLSPLPGYSTCGTTEGLGQAGLALNADGTLNDCTNPATVGSAVTVFLNGFGPVTPALPTGVIPPRPAVTLSPSLDPGSFTGTTVIATTNLPGGSSSGVAQVRLRDDGGAGQHVLLNGPSLDGTPLRDRVILIWTR